MPDAFSRLSPGDRVLPLRDTRWSADRWHQTFRGEAPTTVEAPAEDVTRGVINAVGEIEDLTERKFIKDDAVWKNANGAALLI